MLRSVIEYRTSMSYLIVSHLQSGSKLVGSPADPV